MNAGALLTAAKLQPQNSANQKDHGQSGGNQHPRPAARTGVRHYRLLDSRPFTKRARC